MHFLLYLAAALPTTLALTVPRLQSRWLSERHLVPRTGGRPSPGGEHEPVSPLDGPYTGPHEPVSPIDETGGKAPPGSTVLSPHEVSAFDPEFPLTMTHYYEDPSSIDEKKTGITKPVDGTSTLHIGSEDTHVGASIRHFGDMLHVPEPQFVSENPAGSRTEGQLRRQTAGQNRKRINPRAIRPEGAAGIRAPPGQQMRLAEAMTHGGKKVKLNIDTLPRIQLNDGPYNEEAAIGETVDTKAGTWVPQTAKDGKTRYIYKPNDGTPPAGSKKRRSVIGNISGGGQSASGQNNSMEAFKAQFQTYAATYDAVQANITALIVPFLSTFVQSTNDSMMHDIAWSVYSQLTGSDIIVAGPFMYGMHCLDSLEEQYFKERNISSNATSFDETTTDYLAYHQVLLDTYTSTLSNATAAVNQTGLLSELARLTTFLMPEDESIALPGWYTTPTGPNNDPFFQTFGIKQISNTTSSH